MDCPLLEEIVLSLWHMVDPFDEFSLRHPDNQGHSPSNRLKLISSRDPQFSSLDILFHKGWRHTKTRPKIHSIFKILSPNTSLLPYTAYRKRVADVLSGDANEQLLFHGTNRFCLLGEEPRDTRLCHLFECSLCGIIRDSFDINRCGTKHTFRRFGKGIYTTSCSSKADDYTYNGDKGCRFKVLLVSRVVIGNPNKRSRNASHLTGPPRGYHSVVGEPGRDLNYEETVVYDNDAIRPAFLIVYDLPPADTPCRVM